MPNLHAPDTLDAVVDAAFAIIDADAPAAALDAIRPVGGGVALDSAFRRSVAACPCGERADGTPRAIASWESAHGAHCPAAIARQAAAERAHWRAMDCPAAPSASAAWDSVAVLAADTAAAGRRVASPFLASALAAARRAARAAERGDAMDARAAAACAARLCADTPAAAL